MIMISEVAVIEQEEEEGKRMKKKTTTTTTTTTTTAAMVNQVLPKTDRLTGHSDNILKINGDDNDIRSYSNRARRRRRREEYEEEDNNNSYGEPSFIKDRQADTILFYKN